MTKTNGHGKAGHNSNLNHRDHIYRSYRFIDNKDPVIFKIKTVLQDEGMFHKKDRKRLSVISGVSVSTFDNWFEGDVRTPRHATIAASMASLGYITSFIKEKQVDIERVFKKASQEIADAKQRAARQEARKRRRQQRERATA